MSTRYTQKSKQFIYAAYNYTILNSKGKKEQDEFWSKATCFIVSTKSFRAQPLALTIKQLEKKFDPSLSYEEHTLITKTVGMKNNLVHVMDENKQEMQRYQVTW